MKTPEEINAINSERHKARAESLRRLWDSHPATWAVAVALFYGDYLRAMHETPQQARERLEKMVAEINNNEQRDETTKRLGYSYRQSQSGSTKAAKPLTALIAAAVQENPKVSAKSLWAWLAKRDGVTRGEDCGDGNGDRLLLAGDEITLNELKDRRYRAKKNSR